MEKIHPAAVLQLFQQARSSVVSSISLSGSTAYPQTVGLQETGKDEAELVELVMRVVVVTAGVVWEEMEVEEIDESEEEVGVVGEVDDVDTELSVVDEIADVESVVADEIEHAPNPGGLIKASVLYLD
jgi:hypothetical protein